MVYIKKGVVEGKWEYRGCFKETTSRVLTIRLSEVKTKEQCIKQANEKGYNTIGL